VIAVHVAVIAKQPRPGHVKTRLCPPCTPDEASEIAGAALFDTLDAVDELAARSPIEFEPVLLFDGDPDGWLRPGWRAVPQRGDGLAARLANGFADLGPGVIVGMETPHVVGTAGAALTAIDRGRDTIGLAIDGGYWAIGLHRGDRNVFDGIPMSATNTGLAQLRRLHALGRAVERLPAARDLDTFDDLIDAARRRSGTPRLRAIARAVTSRYGSAARGGTAFGLG
jgi:glycosyltransferase A (GT-A) superfamily protein (DUF2064 family)